MRWNDHAAILQQNQHTDRPLYLPSSLKYVPIIYTMNHFLMVKVAAWINIHVQCHISKEGLFNLLIVQRDALGVLFWSTDTATLGRVAEVPEPDEPICASGEHHGGVIYDTGAQPSHTLVLTMLQDTGEHRPLYDEPKQGPQNKLINPLTSRYKS